MIRIKNATATVWEPDGQLGKTNPVERRGNFQPIRADVAFNLFGVDIKEAHQLLDDVEYADRYKVGGRVVIGTTEYPILGVKVWQFGLTGDHVQVLLGNLNGA